MIIDRENNKLTENFFNELVPEYASIKTDDFPTSGYYNEGMNFSKSERIVVTIIESSNQRIKPAHW